MYIKVSNLLHREHFWGGGWGLLPSPPHWRGLWSDHQNGARWRGKHYSTLSHRLGEYISWIVGRIISSCGHIWPTSYRLPTCKSRMYRKHSISTVLLRNKRQKEQQFHPLKTGSLSALHTMWNCAICSRLSLRSMLHFKLWLGQSFARGKNCKWLKS